MLYFFQYTPPYSYLGPTPTLIFGLLQEQLDIDALTDAYKNLAPYIVIMFVLKNVELHINDGLVISDDEEEYIAGKFPY